jgi:hypothetical protein
MSWFYANNSITIEPKDFVAKLPWLRVEFYFTHHQAPHKVYLILLAPSVFSKHGSIHRYSLVVLPIECHVQCELVLKCYNGDPMSNRLVLEFPCTWMSYLFICTMLV